MADAKTMEIRIVARNDASPVFDKVARDAVSAGTKLRQAGGAGEIGTVKRVGKTIQEIGELADGGGLQKQIDAARATNQAQYITSLKEAATIERDAMVADRARVEAVAERTAANATLKSEIAAINKLEDANLQTAAGRAARDDIRISAAEQRDAAELTYSRIVERTTAVEAEALAIEQRRVASVKELDAATQKYGDRVRQIDKEQQDNRGKILGEKLLGVGAKVGGGLFIADQAGQFLSNTSKNVNEGLDRVNANADHDGVGAKIGRSLGGKSGGEFGALQGQAGEIAGELALAIPGVNSLAHGFKDVEDAAFNTVSSIAKASGASESWVSWLKSGTAQLKDAQEEADKLDKKIAASKERRQVVVDIIQNFDDSRDPTKKIERDRDAKLQKINIAQTSGDIGPKQAKEAMEDVRKEAADAIRDVREKIADELTKITTTTTDTYVRVEAAAFRANGDELSAKLKEIDGALADRRKEIEDLIGKVKNDPTPQPADRDKKVAALEGQFSANEVETAAARKQAIDDGQKARAADYNRIQIDFLDRQVAVGVQGVDVESKKLQIADKYRAAQETIQNKLKEQGITAAQRLVLEHELATLPVQQRGEEVRANQEEARRIASDYNRIQRDGLQTQIDLGSSAAKIEADKLDIAQKYADKLDAINVKLRDVTLDPATRKQLESQRDALPAQQATETRNVVADDARSRTSDINRITRDALQTQADLGDRSAKIEVQKLDIATKYAAKLDEINVKLRDNSLTADERKRLEDAKAALPSQASEETDRAVRGDAIVRQGDRKAAATDGRFISESVAQNSQVEVFGAAARAGADSAKNTADNTKLIKDAHVETNRLLTSLMQIIQAAPAA